LVKGCFSAAQHNRTQRTNLTVIAIKPRNELPSSLNLNDQEAEEIEKELIKVMLNIASLRRLPPSERRKALAYMRHTHMLPFRITEAKTKTV